MSRIGEVQADVTLAAGQQKAFLSVLNAEPGTFHFITGKAGSGKSTVGRQLIALGGVLVSAPTGLAAINVGGQSIHSLFKFPIGILTKSRAGHLPREWADVFYKARIIMIDEVSMVRADLMDAINWSLQRTLECDLPFGGKKVVAFGDMWQLEPVVPEDDKAYMDKHYRSPFWFDAKVFNPDQGRLDGESTEIQIHELNEVFRQSDERFI